jgi:ubiquitin carboxyl-terminal hydrolase 4/11/15
MQKPSLELHPPRLKAFVLSNDFNLETATGPPPRYVCISSKDSLKALCKQLADAVSSSPRLPYRVWKVEGGDFDGSEYPPSKLLPGGASILEENDTSLEDALVESEDSFVVEFKEGENWIVDVPRTIEPLSSTELLPSAPPPLFSSGDDFFSRMGNASSSSTIMMTSAAMGNDLLANPSSSTLLRPAATMDTFGSFNRRNNSQEPGTLGLGNM